MDKPFDQFAGGRDRNGRQPEPQIDLWSVPKHVHSQIRSLIWKWEITPEGHYNWIFMVPSIPVLEFSVPFDRLSLRAFATEILRMLDNAPVSSETSID